MNSTMSLSELLTIIALILTAVALCIVAYQTYLNRKSLLISKQSIDEDRKTRQIQMLPRAHFIFEVQYYLKKWRQEIDEIVDKLESAMKHKDVEIMKELSQKALKNPKGLVSKSFYDKAPAWLSEIWLAGAQYYYNCNAPMTSLWIEREKKAFWDLAPDLKERCKESLYHISQLLTYIDEIVPESYAEAPARLSYWHFLSD